MIRLTFAVMKTDDLPSHQGNTSSQQPHVLQAVDRLAKLPPQALDIEESVLGALMLEKDALTTVIDILKPESFYKETHQEIYRAIVQLFNDAAPIDLRTVVNQLRKNDKLTFVGGAYYITALTTRISSAANIEFHARAILEYAIKRELIAIATEMQRNAYRDTQDIFELLDQAEQALFEVTDSNIRKNYSNMRSLLGEAFKDLETKRQQKDGLTGMDRVTSGWQKAELVIVAARPGMGKTAFLLSALRNAAVDHGYAVAIFSLEMASLQLVNRLISAEAALEGEKIKKGSLADHEWEQLIHKTSQLSQAPIYIDDTPALSIFELRAKCRRLKAKHDIQLIAVDYLQLMSGESIRGAGNREQEIASISRSLKSIAKELNVPVIVGSQLSRAVETRGGNKRPQLSDLRESGSIEQDADMVLFLYRPEYYGMTEDEEGHPTQGMAEVIVAKHRNGPLDSVALKFISKYTQFSDHELPSFSDTRNSTFGTVIHSSKANDANVLIPPSNF
jgi:replicative DNA helicase